MFGETVTRIREVAGSADVYGNPTMTTVETSFDGAAFAPGGTGVALTVGRELATSSPALYFTSAVDALVTDRWRVRGVEYLTDGIPALWVSPFGGATAGTEIRLKVAAG